MLIFLLKTIVASFLIYFTFCFYGNVDDYLFVKAILCTIFLLTMYWVDIYRVGNIFIRYFVAVKHFKKGNMEKAFIMFDELLRKEFAPTLPYLALMRFQGLGSRINAEAAKYHCERAIRNDYHECLYLLAVIDFFGNNLDSYFINKFGEYNDNFSDENPKLKKNISAKSRKNIHCNNANVNTDNNLAENTDDKDAIVKTDTQSNNINNSEQLKIHRPSKKIKNELIPDYPECFFHLKEYLKYNNHKDKNFADANALIAYCYINAKGTVYNQNLGNQHLELARKYKAKNLEIIEKAIKEKTDITEYIL